LKDVQVKTEMGNEAPSPKPIHSDSDATKMSGQPCVPEKQTLAKRPPEPNTCTTDVVGLSEVVVELLELVRKGLEVVMVDAILVHVAVLPLVVSVVTVEQLEDAVEMDAVELPEVVVDVHNVAAVCLMLLVVVVLELARLGQSEAAIGCPYVAPPIHAALGHDTAAPGTEPQPPAALNRHTAAPGPELRQTRLIALSRGAKAPGTELRPGCKAGASMWNCRYDDSQSS